MTSPSLFRPKAVGAGLVVNALTKYIGGHGNALAGSITDTGLFDWTRYPQHRRELQVAAAGDVGHPADPQEGAARLGRHAGGRRRASHRGRRRDARAADGAHLRECPGAGAFLASHPQGAQGVLPGLAVAPAACTRRGRFSAGSAGSSRSSSRMASTVSISSIASRSSCSSSNLGDNRTLAIPVAHTIFWEMGAERRAAMGIADALIRDLGRNRGPRRPDRRFHAGACDSVVIAPREARQSSRCAPALGVEFEIGAAVVPVGEHIAFARAAIDDEAMVRRPMRVAMDDPGDVRLAKRCVDGAGFDVDDGFRLDGGRARGSCAAASAQRRAARHRAARGSFAAACDRARSARKRW